MEKNIIGRVEELRVFESLLRSTKAEFLALYGRRRVGKTFLVRTFFSDKGLYLEITGEKDANKKTQLINFKSEFEAVFGPSKSQTPPKSWQEAFQTIRKTIEKLNTTKKVVLFFDEIPWLSAQKSGFLPALDYFWNRWASRQNNIIVIICGSAASWIIKKVVNDKGGLHNRLTKILRLMPFTLSETELFLQSQGVTLDRKQILEIYLAVGGVPGYLQNVEPGKSSVQNIQTLLFSPQGFLFKEFNKLFASLFDQAEQHIKVVQALSACKSGLTKTEIFEAAGMSYGGRSVEVLTELEEAGFVAQYPSFGFNKKNSLYRLIDEYSLFYLSWIAGLPINSFDPAKDDVWLKKQGSPAWNAWAGCAFEGVCLKHIRQIKKALGISGVETQESGWRFISENRNERGARIDLIIKRADRCIHLCEMKFANAEFVMSKDFLQEFERKKTIFVQQTETKETIFPTLITSFGAAPSNQTQGTVTHQLTLNDLFDK